MQKKCGWRQIGVKTDRQTCQIYLRCDENMECTLGRRKVWNVKTVKPLKH